MHSTLYKSLSKLKNDYCLTINHVYEFVSYYMSNGNIFFADDGTVKITGSMFKDVVEESNTLYTPKNATGKVSYRNDIHWHTYYDERTNSYTCLSFLENGKFLATGTDEMYAIFFYKTDTDEYYGQYLYEMHQQSLGYNRYLSNRFGCGKALLNSFEFTNFINGQEVLAI